MRRGLRVDPELLALLAVGCLANVLLAGYAMVSHVFAVALVASMAALAADIAIAVLVRDDRR